MITKEELKVYAKKSGLHLAQAEKNYLHILVLHAISLLFPELLVFKGGTSLMITQNLPRFSEDLDFTLLKKEKFNEIVPKMKIFLEEQELYFEIEKEETTPISKSFSIRFQGPLYTGTRQTTTKIELDISFRESVINKTLMTRIIPIYPDLPTFYLQTMALEEILAEKIRAILTRQKARDVFDLEYLLAKKISIIFPLIKEKLTYYEIDFSKELFENAIEKKRKIWKPELSNLVPYVEDFEIVKQRILKNF